MASRRDLRPSLLVVVCACVWSDARNAPRRWAVQRRFVLREQWREALGGAAREAQQ